jgi:hypothetical protein
VSWTDDHLFLAARHDDVGRSSLHWWVIALGDGVLGTQTGVQFNSQQPDLGFPVTTVLRWKADNSWNSRLDWDTTAWTEQPTWLGMPGTQLATDGSSAVEIAIPRGSLPSQTQLGIQSYWLFEGSQSESTYAGTPASTLTEGYDPDMATWWLVDLSSATSPQSAVETP